MPDFAQPPKNASVHPRSLRRFTPAFIAVALAGAFGAATGHIYAQGEIERLRKSEPRVEAPARPRDEHLPAWALASAAGEAGVLGASAFLRKRRNGRNGMKPEERAPPR